MANPRGNPRISEYGKLTRFTFGGRNCPLVAQQEAAPPWSIRRAVRRIARTTFDVADGPEIPIPTRKAIRRALTGSGRFLTGAEVIAVELWLAALAGDLGSMQRVIDMTDGKLR